MFAGGERLGAAVRGERYSVVGNGLVDVAVGIPDTLRMADEDD